MHGSIHSMKTSVAALEVVKQMLAQALADAMSAIIGESVQVRHVSAPDLLAGSPAWFLSEFDEFPGSALLFGATREVWLTTGRKLLTGNGAIGADDETALSAVREMVAKGVNTLASALSGKLKRDVGVKVPRQLAAMPESVSLDSVSGLEIEFHDETKVALTLVVDPKLTAALCAAERHATSGLAGSPVNTKNLDLLLDVEMPVSVSFGRAQLPLKHVIKLTTGSIVELGRSVSEPVDIIVNNTVIARGEVVVVGGNFGVRVQEILSKQDRLRTLT